MPRVHGCKCHEYMAALQRRGQITILFGGMDVIPLEPTTSPVFHPGIRPPIVDGLFYPAQRSACADRVDELLDASPVPRAAGFAVVAPHAGYEYAGDVMAAAYRFISLRQVRTAVLIGPVHRDPADVVYLPESDAFSTPLGEVPVDGARIEALLRADPLFRRNDIPHLEEHCLELQLPFLLRLFPGVTIVPLLVGNNRAATAAVLQRALRLTFANDGDYTVFVVTANMASYLGGRDADAESSLMQDYLERCDGTGMLAAAEKRQLSACGVAGIAAVVGLAGEGCTASMLARGSSRGREEDPSRIVHYAAAGIAQRAPQ
jgi:AmmeMemoRadiSam system protein B